MQWYQYLKFDFFFQFVVPGHIYNVLVWVLNLLDLYVFASISASCSILEFSPQTRRLFVGLENGVISEFSLSEDYNSLRTRRDYLGKRDWFDHTFLF